VSSLLGALATSVEVGFRSRLRHAVIWVPSALFLAFFIIEDRLASHSLAAAVPAADRLAAWPVVAWLTAACGSRVLPERGRFIDWRTGGASVARMRQVTVAVAVGAAAADSLALLVGGLLASALSFGHAATLPELLLPGIEALLTGAALSLQFELAIAFATRPLALLATALLTALTLSAGALPWGGGWFGWGALVFPVSAFARAAEEPLRIELGVRAILAGAVYVLALVAALFALVPIRARGKA
jgi:hypothetical protein